MSYEIITGCLITRTALHVGAGEGNSTTDALLRQDAQGRLLIPGTALAGTLRTIATRLAPRLGHKACWALWPEDDPKRPPNKACKCPVCHLFGDINPQEQENDGDASRLWIADAFLKTAIPETQIRDGVGIDRRSRVAARQGAVKFDLEVLPPESAFTLRFELQDTNLTDEQLLAAALAEWEQGRGTIGGRVRRGLGAFRLQGLQRASRNLNDKEELLLFLKHDKPWLDLKPKKNWLKERLDELRLLITPVNDEYKNLDVARALLEVQYKIEATGSFLVNDPLTQAQSGFDHAPLINEFINPDRKEKSEAIECNPEEKSEADPEEKSEAKENSEAEENSETNPEEKLKPVLPGSSLRGALRSQAERIARTLATIEAWQQNDDKQQQQYFASHCPACDPNARRKREEGSSPVALESCDSLLLANKVESDEEVEEKEHCLACWLFGSARQGSRLLVEDARFIGLKPTYKVRDFVAIDRFTGGAAEQYKFDAVELWKPQFEGQLRLENPTHWELGWLLLTLRDLQDGLIPLGFGAAKGMGRVKINEWTVRLGFLHKSDVPGELPANVSTFESGLYQVAGASWTPNHPPSAWKSQAESWVQSFNQHLTSYQRQERLPKMMVDSYFGQESLTKLYPIQVKKNGKD